MNPNLLQMNTVPVKIEINVTRASLESPGKQLPRMKVSTNKGGYRMEARPAKLNIDTYAARSSMGLGHKNMGDFTYEEAQRGIKLAYQGTARVAEEGNEFARGSSPVEVAKKNFRAGFSIQTVMDFIPKTGANFTYEDGVLNIDYQLDDMNIDWEHVEASRLIFNPGTVEINVAQHPRIEIEYVGEPIYVPPSANPNYEPILNVLG
ncbi:MAG: DUF6470 family protein [Oscillospiraceae bacterium]|nr:DUF6470 family protein [Oscillospiraceae bacterium]